MLRRTGWVIAAGALLLLLKLTPAAPHSGTPCATPAQLSRQLGALYDEAPVAFGMQSNGNLLQLYRSAKSGSWTIVSTTPGGRACVVAAGHAWADRPPAHVVPVA